MRRHIQHGPRRLWLRPWKVVCTCGLESSPCYAVQMLQSQAWMQPRPTMARTVRPSVAPLWNGHTQRLDELPLLTPGQAERSRLR